MGRDTRWIFFDVGYTLLDETPAWREQFQRLSDRLSALGISATPAAIWTSYETCCTDFAARQWNHVVHCYAPDLAKELELRRLSAGWRHDLEVPFPGTRETLAELSGHFKLGIIANQSHGTRERMKKHGLLQYLSLVIGSAEAGVSKPDPAIFEMALREAGCSASEAVMVGDRIDNDVRPASLLGMKTVHVRQGGSGKQRPRDATEVPTASIEQIAELTPGFVRSLS